MKFEGIVNGEKFTDRESYNARIAELVAAGESINASSTETACSCQGGECSCNGCNQPDEPASHEEPRAMFVLPYVNDDMTVAEDEILEAADASDVEEKLRALTPDNIRAIDQMNIATRSQLLDDLEQIEKNLDAYKEEISERTSALAEEYLKACALKIQAEEIFPELKGFMRAMALYTRGQISSAEEAEKVIENTSEGDPDEPVDIKDAINKILKKLFFEK